jgi:hypothetical protein
MAQSRPDAWARAAECEALAQRSEDAKLRKKFLKLRNSWIRIANSAGLAGTRADNEAPPHKSTN